MYRDLPHDITSCKFNIMAKIELFLPKLLELEGNFVKDPADHGGATNMGITLSTWKCVGYDKDGDRYIDEKDLRMLDHEDVKMILKKFYWDRWKADEIIDQKLANMLVDWLWSSGKWGILIPQRLLGQKEDGIPGPGTISAVNSSDPSKLLIRIYNARLAFIRNLIRRDPSQEKFGKGWTNRINTFL